MEIVGNVLRVLHMIKIQGNAEGVVVMEIVQSIQRIFVKAGVRGVIA